MSHARRRSLLGVLAVAFVSLGLTTPAAPAAASQISIMQDDDLLIYRDDDTRDRTLKKMKALGVDAVRVTLLWERVAEDAKKTEKREDRFERLGADDPRAYPKLNWDRYDRLVRAGRTLGVNILFNVTGPGPKWAHGKAPKGTPSSVRDAWRPDADDFHDFVRAVGKRYSGEYKDENDGRRTLPKVSFWSIWNEPNQAGWLAPQYADNKLEAPRLYRELWFEGRRALDKTGHEDDVVLVGETAPIGRKGKTSRTPIYPETFIRTFLCMDGPRKGCGLFGKYGPIDATAWAHHPYTRDKAPTEREEDDRAITLANIGDLTKLLDEAAAKTGRVPDKMPIMNTEFGYETNPPDPHNGISLEKQAQNLVAAEYIQYLNPRILATSQFLLTDVDPRRKHTKGTKAYWFTYQSGLFGRTGTPKPAAFAYSFPFVSIFQDVDPASGQRRAGVWGMMRFRPNNLPPGTDKVVIQWQSPVTNQWYNVSGLIPVTSNVGYFVSTITVPGPGKTRAVWAAAPGQFVTSVEGIVP